MRTYSFGSSVGLLMCFTTLAGCMDGDPIQPGTPPPTTFSADELPPTLAMQLRTLAQQKGIGPMPAKPTIRPELALLGQKLLFDKILSGKRNISCMTCHLPGLATGDARSLSIGEGATGLGANRVHPRGVFIPRNAPPLFDLQLLNNLFWDGRVSFANGTFSTPAGAQLTPAMTSVFQFGALSAIGMFPVTNREEMRGLNGTSELAIIPNSNFTGIWAALMRRLGSTGYVPLFLAAYPGTSWEQMTFAHASNAMAAFLIQAYSFADAPWDRFLAGNDAALTSTQIDGGIKFMNAPCSGCHSGASFSSGGFMNVATAQFGPGQGNGPSGRDDFGRMNVTGLTADQYKFRATPLRNVELTGPYGHAGQFSDLSAFIDHYSQSDVKLRNYTPSMIPDPLLRTTLLDNKEAVIATRAAGIVGVNFDATFTSEVTAFMNALTDDRARDLSNTIPATVPSGLPVDR